MNRFSLLLVALVSAVPLLSNGEDVKCHAPIGLSYNAKSSGVTTTDGSEITIPSVDWDGTYSEDAEIGDFMSSVTEIYSQVRSGLVRDGAKGNVADSIMAKWLDVVSLTIYDSLGKQFQMEQERLNELASLTEDERLDLAAQFANSSIKVSLLNTTYQQTMAGIVAITQEMVVRAKQDQADSNRVLKQKVEALETAMSEGGNVDAAQNEVIVALVNKCVDEKMLTMINDSGSSLNAHLNGKVDPISSAITANSNNWIAVSKWLGGTNETNRGAFVRPKMIDGGDFEDDDDISYYLGDRGCVGMYCLEMKKIGYVPKFRSWFEEDSPSEDTTNVTASFSAPTNWAGNGLTVTNGAYALVKPIYWVTNVTEEAQVAITNIFNEYDNRTFVTNLVVNNDNRQFVTNIVFNNDNRQYITNLVQNVDARTFITNISFDVDQRTFVTNVTQNMDARTFITNISHNADNRRFVTNIVNNYKTSVTNLFYMIGVPKDGELTPPKPAPEDDPYDPGYVEPAQDDPWSNLLPEKNARFIVGLTNNIVKASNMRNALDFRSVNTNNESETIQVAGFEKVTTTNYFPVSRKLKRTDGSEYIGVEWMELRDSATNSLTQAEYNTIRKITNIDTNILELSQIVGSVTNNTIAINEIKTNFFSRVQADTLLDNASVWTNGEKRVEVKGYHKARVGEVPMADENNNGERGIRWGWQTIPDGFATPFEVFHSSLNWQEDASGSVATGTVEVAGFSKAKEFSVPFKKELEDGRGEVEYGMAWAEPPSGVTADAPKVLQFDGSTVAWGNAGGAAIKFIGTDGVGAVCGIGAQTNTVTFSSDTNSNVIVSCEGNGNGNVKITIGVYYADEGL